MASQQPSGESQTINISTTKCANGFTAASWRIQHHKYFNKQMRKWLHSSLLENPKPLVFQQKNMRKLLHNSILENQTQLILQNKLANGFTTASWRIQNHKYLNKKCANGFTAASWRIQNHQYFNKKMRKWFHSNLLENPKP